MSDLIERLRFGFLTFPNGDLDLQRTDELTTEAADALESQAKRIAELESEVARLRVDAERWNDCVANGFPMFAKPVATSHAGHWWCVRNGISYQGMTPAAAIDAAKEQS